MSSGRPMLHRRGVLPGSEGEEADPVRLSGLLRLGGERRGEEATGHGAEERTPVHTLSTWPHRIGQRDGTASGSNLHQATFYRAGT